MQKLTPRGSCPHSSDRHKAFPLTIDQGSPLPLAIISLTLMSIAPPTYAAQTEQVAKNATHSPSAQSAQSNSPRNLEQDDERAKPAMQQEHQDFANLTRSQTPPHTQPAQPQEEHAAPLQALRNPSPDPILSSAEPELNSTSQPPLAKSVTLNRTPDLSQQAQDQHIADGMGHAPQATVISSTTINQTEHAPNLTILSQERESAAAAAEPLPQQQRQPAAVSPEPLAQEQIVHPKAEELPIAPKAKVLPGLRIASPNHEDIDFGGIGGGMPAGDGALDTLPGDGSGVAIPALAGGIPGLGGAAAGFAHYPKTTAAMLVTTGVAAATWTLTQTEAGAYVTQGLSDAVEKATTYFTADTTSTSQTETPPENPARSHKSAFECAEDPALHQAPANAATTTSQAQSTPPSDLSQRQEPLSTVASTAESDARPAHTPEPEPEPVVAQAINTEEPQSTVTENPTAPTTPPVDTNQTLPEEPAPATLLDAEQDTDTAPDAEPESPPLAPEPIVTASTPPAIAKAPVRPIAGSYNSNAWAANTLFQLNLDDRLDSYPSSDTPSAQGSAWIRYHGSRSHLRDDSDELRTQGDKNTIQMGINMLGLPVGDRAEFTLGVMGGYGHYSGRTRSSRLDDFATGKVDGHSIGLYSTYQQNASQRHGLYADTWVLWNRFNNSVKTESSPAERYNARGLTASLELGYHFTLAEHDNVKYVLRPQTQLIYQNVRANDLHQVDGTRIDFLNSSRLQSTIGLRAAAHISTGISTMITPHIEANWLHATKGYGVKLDNTATRMDSGRNIGQLKLGLQGDLNRRVSLSLELVHQQGNGGYRETGGNLAGRYRY